MDTKSGADRGKAHIEKIIKQADCSRCTYMQILAFNREEWRNRPFAWKDLHVLILSRARFSTIAC